MSTTNLLVDFLVIGVTAFVWVLPIFCVFFGAQWLASTKTLGVGTLPLVLGLTYAIGLAVSNAADVLTDRWNRRAILRVFDNSTAYHRRLNFVVATCPDVDQYLAYRRGIVRIARSSALNFALGVPAWALCYPWTPVERSGTVLLCVSFAAIAASLGYQWHRSLPGYLATINDFYCTLTARPGTPEHREDRRRSLAAHRRSSSSGATARMRNRRRARESHRAL